MANTPDRFPGTREEDGLYLVPTTDAIPAQEGSVQFKTAYGLEVYQEGASRPLVMSKVNGEAAAESSTTAEEPTYVQKLRISATVVTGIYLLGWYAEWYATGGNKALSLRIQQDDSTDIAIVTPQNAQPDLYMPVSGWQRLSLAAGSYDFDLDYARADLSGPSFSVFIRNARMQLLRIA